jgi:hypothetical protein
MAPMTSGATRRLHHMSTPVLAVIVLLRAGVGADAGSAVGMELVDALARLQLAAQRAGCRIAVRDACGELQDVADLAGLREALGVEVGREIERGEQVLVEEVVVADDPVA